MSANEQQARERASAAGQGHLFRHFDSWSPAERGNFLKELSEVDFSLVAKHRAMLLESPHGAPSVQLAPAEVFGLRRDSAQQQRAARAIELGARNLAAGKVGYLVVAGGQASRLGYDGPKGAFRIGPVSDASLFELHARRLRAAAQRYGCATPWYVMTSRANEAPTREFFAAHRYFGLPEQDVFFFSQAMVPALDFEGRILMSGPGALFLAPNGHGGSLEAFARSGALDDARRRGLEQLSYFQVDNPLAPPADPLFLGLHAELRASMSSKVVAKRDASEKVGVIGKLDGRLGCIEYSDLPSELREARDASGELRFGAGNIALHVIDVDFVDTLCRGGLQLPWHVAKKTMNVWRDGAPAAVQGAKFETFVFDALERAERSVTLEVERKREFSPVKNAAGEDSPQTTRADLCRLHAEWISARGWPLPAPDASGVHPVEVDPLVAEDVHEFLARAPLQPIISAKGHLYR